MKFIFQKFHNDIWQQDLISATKDRGHQVLEVNPSENLELSATLLDFCDYPSFFGKGDANIEPYFINFFGSVKFVEKCHKHYKNAFYLKSQVTTKNYLCTNYYPYVFKHLFNDFHSFYLTGNVEHQKWQIYNTYGKDCNVFMRPNSGEKEFAAGLFDLQYFDKDWDSIKERLNPEDLILVSTPKNIRSEFRFVCDNKNNIITGSCYRYQGKITIIPSYPKEAYEKCEKILTDLQKPDKIFTIDICEDNDGNFWLMEINSFYSAGLYACDKNKILEWIENESKKL